MTVNETIEYLKSKGYTRNLVVINDQIFDNKRLLNPENMSIDHTFRVESDSDPTHQAIIYGVSSYANNIKGLIIDSYGTYSDSGKTHVIEKISKSA